MTEIEPFDRLRVMKLSETSFRLAGTLDQTAAGVDALRRSRGVVSVSDSVPTGVPGQVMLTVRILPRVQRAVPAAKPRIHPGWIVAILCAAALLVVAVGWVAIALLHTLAALLPVLIVIAVICGLALVGLGKLGGVNISQNNFLGR